LLTKRQPREHRTHTPSNRIRPCGELMPPGLFGSTTIDCAACMEKANTRGTAGATGVVVALEPVSKIAADITDGRALGGNLRLIRSSRPRCLPAPTKRSNPSFSNPPWIAHPKANSSCSSAGPARAIPLRSAVALPVDAISNANCGESRTDANVPAFRVA
jgi:hypothetical protein